MFYVIAIEDRDEQCRTFLVYESSPETIQAYAAQLANDFEGTLINVQTLDDAFDRNDVVELVTF